MTDVGMKEQWQGQFIIDSKKKIMAKNLSCKCFGHDLRLRSGHVPSWQACIYPSRQN